MHFNSRRGKSLAQIPSHRRRLRIPYCRYQKLQQRQVSTAIFLARGDHLHIMERRKALSLARWNKNQKYRRRRVDVNDVINIIVTILPNRQGKNKSQVLAKQQ
jgi:hypothetical protein